MEHQEKKIDELKDMMLTFTADVKDTFTEIAYDQKECENDFKRIRAELKGLKGDMSRMKANARKIKGAMKEPKEKEDLETDKMSMEACCTCGGPILDTDDGTPGGTACTGTCRHRMCCNWCIVANDRCGPRCRHCLNASAPDGAAPEETVVLSQPRLFDEEELNQMEKDVVATVFEPKLQSHSQMYNCYICEKYTKYQLKCKACEWLTCPMCQGCFDDLHGSCKQPRDDDGSIPDLDTGSDDDTENKYKGESSCAEH